MTNGSDPMNAGLLSEAPGKSTARHMSIVLSDAVERGDVPGIVVCAANAEGEIYSGVFGVADTGLGDPMCEDTLFFIASMTKAVTHIAVLQLVEQGRLSLDDKAADFVPSLANMRVLEGFDGGGAPILRPSRCDITVRQLLAYTAGFAYPYWNADIKRYVEWAELPGNVSYLTSSLDLPLVSDPGDVWNYGINSEFLGMIVEAVSGDRLDRYFQKHIFEPLGMRSTFYIVPADKRHRIAKIHTRMPDGALSAIAMSVPEDPEFYPGGVGLFSTAGDYLALTRMLLCGGTLGGQRILRSETVAMMACNQLDGAKMDPLRTCDLFWSCDVDLFAGQETQWGLGFLLNTQALGTGRAAFSLSWGGACNTFYWIDRTRGITGVFMTCLIPFCDQRALAAFTAFESSIYATL